MLILDAAKILEYETTNPVVNAVSLSLAIRLQGRVEDELEVALRDRTLGKHVAVREGSALSGSIDYSLHYLAVATGLPVTDLRLALWSLDMDKTSPWAYVDANTACLSGDYGQPQGGWVLYEDDLRLLTEALSSALTEARAITG